MKDKKFLALSSLFFLLFFAMVSISFFDSQTKGGFLRAKNATFSPLKSFAVVFPQIGIAGAENSPKPPTKIKVTVYVRDVNGEVMPNKSVKLTAASQGVTFMPADTQTTNETGMAQFFVSSQNPGRIQLSVTDLSTNSQIANIPSVEFTQ